MSRILVAEDDRLVSSFVGKGLRSHGFAVGTAETGEDAVALCRTGDFDLMLLDMGLPDTDGLNVLRRVREDRLALPVIVLTGRPERDVVTCLHAGADDYLAKPFAFTELLARVEARLRVTPSAEPELLQAGDLVLDLHTRRARAGGRSIDLTGREFALLETFMRHADQVLSRQQVLSHVWGYSFDPGTNVVNVYVNALRKKIGAERIETARGSGYRLRKLDLSTTRNAG